MSKVCAAVSILALLSLCVYVAIILCSNNSEPFYQSITNLAHPEPIFVFDSAGNEKLRREMSYQTTPSTMGGSPDGIHINVNNYKEDASINITKPKNNTPNPLDAQIIEAVPYQNDDDAYYRI